MRYVLHGGKHNGVEVNINARDMPYLLMTDFTPQPVATSGDEPIYPAATWTTLYTRRTMAYGQRGTPDWRCWFEYWEAGHNDDMVRPRNIPDRPGDYT